MRGLVVGVLGTLGLLGGVLALLERPPERAALPSAGSGAEVVRGAPGGAPRASAPARPPRVAAAREVAGAAPALAEDARALDRARRTAFVEGLDRRLADEAEDGEWASRIEAQAVAALADPRFAGTTVRSAECRRTLCRVELDHASDEAREKFLERVTFTAPFDGKGYVKWAPPGEAGPTRVWIAREGHSLTSAVR